MTAEELFLVALHRIEQKVDKLLAGSTTPPRPYTREEAAKYLGISPQTLKEKTLEGEISCSPIGGGKTRAGRLRYTQADLDEYLSRNRRQAVTNLSR